MPWNYVQTTGKLYHNNELVGTGYSGHGEGVNNPAMQFVPNIGPIPQGEYTIGEFFDDPGGKGPIVAHLIPMPTTKTNGRSGFMIHGDNNKDNHSASEGCMIFWHEVRVAVRDSGDKQLIVTRIFVPLPVK